MTITGKVATMAAVMTLFACNSKNKVHPLAPKNITIESKINDQAQSMATPGYFEAGDQISIYAWKGDNAQVPSAGELIINNAINTYDMGKWTAESFMSWSDETTAHYFIGIHPTKAVTDFVSDTYDNTPDLLVATNLTGLNSTQGNVPLAFDHVMSKLVVKLTFRNQFGDSTPTVSDVTSEIKTGATVNYLTKTVTPLATDTDNVSLHPISANTSYSIIAAPQTLNKIYITIADKIYTYNNKAGFTLESGKQRIVELIVGHDIVELADVTINDWGTSDTITGGEAQ